MQWDILATILLTATIQSLLGVGVLLYSKMSTERSPPPSPCFSFFPARL